MAQINLEPRWCMAAAMAVACASASGARPISYESFKQGQALFHSVLADLSSDRVSAGTLHSDRLTSLWTFVKEKQPAVAVTGTFFCPRSQRPVADVLVDGQLVASGDRGSVLAVDWAGRASIFDTRFKAKVDWSKYRYALRGAVRVVSAGKVSPNPKAQRFRDSSIWGRAARIGVGTTRAGKLVLVATKSAVTLSELGRALVAKGATEGISLDGGSSTCLYYHGSLVVAPKRRLSNLLVLYEHPSGQPPATPPASISAVGEGRTPIDASAP